MLSVVWEKERKKRGEWVRVCESEKEKKNEAGGCAKKKMKDRGSVFALTQIPLHFFSKKISSSNGSMTVDSL